MIQLKLNEQVLQLVDLVFAPLRDEDLGLVHSWLNAPHVMEKWDSSKSLEETKQKYSDKITSDWQSAFIISKDGKQFAYIQS